MKKIVTGAMRLLTLLAVALTAGNAAADVRVYVEDFAVKPGEVGVMNVMMDNDEEYNGVQVDIFLPEGLSASLNRRGKPIVNETDRTDGFTVDGDIISSGALRVLAFNTQNYEILGNSGSIITIEVEAADDFVSGQQALVNNIGLSLKGDETTPYHSPDMYYTVYGTTPLDKIVGEGVDGQKYFVDGQLAIVDKSEAAGCVFASDGDGNWIKIAASGDVLTALLDMSATEDAMVGGVLSNVDTNPTITITTVPEEPRRGPKVNTETYNLKTWSDYSLQPNEVAYVIGYYSVENGTPTLRGWLDGSTEKGTGRGPSLTINMDWCDKQVDFIEGNHYKVYGAVQLNQPWSAGAPRRIAADDNNAFTNYTLFPLSANETTTTGIVDVNADDEVQAIYSIDGRRVNDTTVPGIYIIKGAKSTRKVIVQ